MLLLPNLTSSHRWQVILVVSSKYVKLSQKPLVKRRPSSFSKRYPYILNTPRYHRSQQSNMLNSVYSSCYQFLEYFFQEADAKFFRSLGLNCIRAAFNYRHFEDDMNPRVLKPQGFKHLDRVISICAQHGIYTILDLHTAPGGQNQASLKALWF